MYTINLKHLSKEPKLLARLTWQVLFNKYREQGGPLTEMGDMLVDYTTLITFFEECFTGGGTLFKVFWRHMHGTFLTETIRVQQDSNVTTVPKPHVAIYFDKLFDNIIIKEEE